jgi:hypothetical protein
MVSPTLQHGGIHYARCHNFTRCVGTLQHSKTCSTCSRLLSPMRMVSPTLHGDTQLCMVCLKFAAQQDMQHIQPAALAQRRVSPTM